MLFSVSLFIIVMFLFHAGTIYPLNHWKLQETFFKHENILFFCLNYIHDLSTKTMEIPSCKRFLIASLQLKTKATLPAEKCASQLQRQLQ